MVSGKPSAIPDVADRFNFRFAASKLLALALFSLEPRDLVTGERLAAGQLMSQVQSGHDSSPLLQIFPVRAGKAEKALRSAANRLIQLPRQRGVRRLLAGIDDSRLLLSHGISAAARQALDDGDSAAFLKLRAEWMRPRVEIFFARHARWDEPDRPRIASLIVDDEEG